MKAITSAQWDRMDARKRSWLVCRALGENACVFWHCTKANGDTVGGSYQTKEYCDGLIKAAKKMTRKQAERAGVPFPSPFAETHPVPTVAFAQYAEYAHLAARLINVILEDHGAFELRKNGRYLIAFAGAHSASSLHFTDLVCSLFLISRALLIDLPF